ncbi:polyhedrin [Biston robustus cypovirus]|nr:polyhedrin [Biston robustus cypovirus]
MEGNSLREREQEIHNREINQRLRSPQSYIYCYLVLTLKDGGVKVIRIKTNEIASRCYTWEQLVARDIRFEDYKCTEREYVQGLVTQDGGRSHLKRHFGEPVSYQLIFLGDIDKGSIRFSVRDYMGDNSYFDQTNLLHKGKDLIGRYLIKMHGHHGTYETAWTYSGKFSDLRDDAHPSIFIAFKRHNRDGFSKFSPEMIASTLLNMADTHDTIMYFDSEQSAVENFFIRHAVPYRNNNGIDVC